MTTIIKKRDSNYLCQAFQSFPHFIVWRYMNYGTRQKPKYHKVPFKCDDRSDNLRYPIDPHDPANWTDYNTACTFLRNHPTYNGLGFVLTRDCGFVCADLDWKHFVPREPTSFQLTLIDAFAGATYLETSASGMGLHAWFKGYAETLKRPHPEVEIYSEGQYIALTFQPLLKAGTWDTIGNIPLADWQTTLQRLGSLADSLKQARQQSLPTMPTGAMSIAINEMPNIRELVRQPMTELDNKRWMMAVNAKNGSGKKFLNLFQGKWQLYYPSQSEGDLALCNMIAFYWDTPEQVARVFLHSKLGERIFRGEKSLSYLWRTINLAFDRKLPSVPFTSTISSPIVGGA